MSKRISVLLPSILALSAFGMSQDVSATPTTTPTLYVDNSVDNSVSVIDVGTEKVISTVTVGDLPHAICASGDGRKVWTSIESPPYSMKSIDTATNAVVDTIPLPENPNECTVTTDGHYVVTAIRGNNSAVIIDTTTNKIVKSLPIKGAHNCNTPMGGSNDTVYCEEQRGYDIAKIDLKTMEIVGRIKVNGEARPFIVTPDQKTIYVALSALSGFAIVDVATDMITEVVLPPTPGLPCTIEPGNTPTHGIGLTPDLKNLWVTNVGGAGAYVYNVATKKLSAKIPVGKCPNWFAISSDGKYAAVTNAESNSVSVMDAKTHKLLAEIPVGKGPKRMEFVDVPKAAN